MSRFQLSSRRPYSRPHSRPAAEALERRRLLAADSVTFDRNNGLAFVGTENNNVVTVSFSGSTYTIADSTDVIDVSNDNPLRAVTGSGTHTVTVKGFVDSLSFDTGVSSDPGVGFDTFNIASINDPTTVEDTHVGVFGTADVVQTVNVGDGATAGSPGTLQGIRAPLTVSNTSPNSHTDLTLDDSQDASPHAATLTASDLTGLSPATVSFGGSHLDHLNVRGGGGGNSFTVTGTVASAITNLGLGSGSDAATVAATGQGSSLNVGNSGGHDAVTLGGAAHDMEDIAGFVNVFGGTGALNDLTLDDSLDNAPRTVTLDTQAVNGVSAHPINFDQRFIAQLTLDGGPANNTFTVVATVAGSQTNLNGGAGSNTFTVEGADLSSTLNINNQGGLQADRINFGSSGDFGSSGSVQSVAGTVNVAGPAGSGYIFIDDSSDPVGRTATVSGNSVTGILPGSIHYATDQIYRLDVLGGTGADTFDVTPAADTQLALNGLAPAAPSSPADAFNLNLAGITGASVSDSATSSGHYGEWSFAHGAPVLYGSMETLSPAPSSAVAVSSVGVSDSATSTTAQSQRSQVRGLIVTLASPAMLTLDQVNLGLLNTGGSGSNDGSAPTSAKGTLGTPATSDGGTTWVVPVLANTTQSDATGGLTDGIYTLTVFGVANGPVNFTFHRLFGDTDGNGTVNALDYARFKQGFGSSTGAAGYNAALDFDGNGTINALDYAQFKKRFGMTFVYS